MVIGTTELLSSASAAVWIRRFACIQVELPILPSHAETVSSARSRFIVVSCQACDASTLALSRSHCRATLIYAEPRSFLLCSSAVSAHLRSCSVQYFWRVCESSVCLFLSLSFSHSYLIVPVYSRSTLRHLSLSLAAWLYEEEAITTFATGLSIRRRVVREIHALRSLLMLFIIRHRAATSF